MFHGLQQAALELAERHADRVRVVILSGAGRAFCTGLDVPSVLSGQHGLPWQTGAALLEKKPIPIRTAAATGMVVDGSPSNSPSTTAAAAYTNLAQDVGYLWRQLPVPVIASLHGMCYGGGLQIALGADIRLCHPDTKISILETKWGLIPDMSLSVTLRELVPIDVAKELIFTGRIVSGAAAAPLGLVTRCEDDPLSAAHALARELGQRSPDALRLAKQLLQQTWRTGATEQDCLQWESEYQQKLLLSWNQVAASARNLGWKLPYRTTSNR